MFRSSLFAALCLISFTAGSLLPQTPLNSVDAPPKWSWKSCGLPTDVVQIKDIEISPDPPLPGQPMTVTVSGTAQEIIKPGATADVTVKVGLIKILSKTFDLCEEAEKANATVQCPVEKGDYVVVQTVDLPKEIPPAKFNIHVVGYTDEDDALVCVDLTIDFLKRLLW